MTDAAGTLPVGIGLRQAHHEDLLARRPALDFVEVHAENFFAPGGAAPALLDEVRRHYAVSLHGVGLSLGAAAGLDAAHLSRLAALSARVDPALVSDHVAFARGPLQADQPPVHAADLLPVAFTADALAVLASNVQRAQDALRRPLLVENLSSYLAWEDDHLDEPAFLGELCRQTGCGLLLDLNNLVVNALNRGASDPVAWCGDWLSRLPAGVVGEIHLAGHSPALPGRCVVDDHGQPVGEAVWQVFADALRRCGPVPTLIEWDTDLPALDVLLAQAGQAQAIAQRVLGLRAGRVDGPRPALQVQTGPQATQWPAREGDETSRRLTRGEVREGRNADPRQAADAAHAPAAAAEAAQREAARQGALLRQLFGQRDLDDRGDRGSPVHGRWTALPRSAPPARAPEAGEAIDVLAPYRRNAAATAARALRVAYPTVAAMLGEEAWQAAAWSLWRAYPPRSGDLADWGAALPHWLEQQESLRPWPWLADSARLDWAVHAAARAADALPEPQTLALLGEWPADRLHLLLTPGTAVVCSDWPVATLYAAHRPAPRPHALALGHPADRLTDAVPGNAHAASPAADQQHLHPGTPLQSAREAVARQQAECACIARRGWAVDVQAIDLATAAWMADLLAGLPLSQALQRAQDRAADVGLLDVTEWLTQALRQGWIERAVLRDASAA
jgi:uncharacterized protein (UPF0276 family)